MGYKISEQPNASLEEGTEVDYEGSRFRVAHAGNVKFQRALSRIQKPYRRQIEKGELDPGTQKKLLVKAISQAILLDWSKVTDSSGKEIPYTPALGEQALMNDEALREFIMEFSMDLANFKETEEAEEVKS
jgi:hypothetical protein